MPGIMQRALSGRNTEFELEEASFILWNKLNPARTNPVLSLHATYTHNLGDTVQFIIALILYTEQHWTLLSNVHWTLYLFTLHCTLYNLHCTLYTVHCKLYTVHCTLYTVHCTLYTVHCTLCTVHCTLYTGLCTTNLHPFTVFQGFPRFLEFMPGSLTVLQQNLN